MAPKNQSTTSSPNQSSLTSVNNGRTVSQNTFNNGSSETSKSFGDIATCVEVLTNHDDQKESENDVKNITNCESSNVDSQWVSSETKSEQSDKEDIITEPKQENKDIPEEDENDGAVKSYDHKVVPLQPFKSLQEIQEVLKEEEEEFDSAEESDDDSFSVPDVKDEDLRMFGMKDREVSESIEALENGTFAPVDLLRLIKILGNEIEHCEIELKDELEKRKRYKIDHSRRTHNYDQFIITFLAMLAEQGKLGDLVKEQLQPTRKRPHPHPTNSRTKSANSKKSDNKISPNNSGKKRGRKKKAKGKRKR